MGMDIWDFGRFGRGVTVRRITLALTVALAADPAAANGWSQILSPSRGPARVFGETTAGCMAGAEALPLDGPGYLVMHIERRRYFGHPNLIRSIKSLGHGVFEQGIGPLQIGDLAQPRGGPMPSGHRSHQTGLDVDIWFNLDARLYAHADALRSNISAPSMLNAAHDDLNRRLWTPDHAQALRMAALQPAVERIFVNPYIKRELCARVRSDRSWLHKIRPWFGHDDHFHVRLGCPDHQGDCRAQPEVPAGDGCDDSLDWWLEQRLPIPTEKPGPEPILPSACRSLLARP